MGRRLRKCKSIGVIFILLLVFPSLSAGEPETGSLSIDHAYLRRPVPKFDPGTIHMFLRNQGPKPITVTRIYVNDIPLPSEITTGESGIWEGVLPQGLPPPMEEKLDDRFIWHQVLPNPILPGKVADVMVKLAYATQQLIKIEVETADGQRLHRVIHPIDNPFRITFIGFSDELDKVYIYLENNANKPLTVAKVFLNMEDITSLCSIPWENIPPGRKRCIVARLKKPLTQGEYIAVKVPSNEEDLIKAEAVVRVFTYFPIGSRYGDDTRTHFFFDPFHFFLEYPHVERRFVKTRTAPSKRAYLAMNNPNLYDNIRKEKVGATAEELLTRIRRCRREDQLHPAFVKVDVIRQEQSYFVYGEIADMMGANFWQLQMGGSRRKDALKENAYLTELAKVAVAPRLLYGYPAAFCFKKVDSSFPSPEEERLLVYYIISRGAKGIFYKQREQDGDCNGYSFRPKLEAELGEINAELQILRRFLIVGDPLPLAKCNEPKVEANTILCGEHAIVLILINDDYSGHFEKGKSPFIYRPKQNLLVTVRVPDWMDIKDAYEVVGGQCTKLNYSKNGADILLSVKKLDLTRQIVLTTDSGDYDYDGDGDGIPDREKVKWLSLSAG